MSLQKDKRKESCAPSEEDLKWVGRRDTMVGLKRLCGNRLGRNKMYKLLLSTNFQYRILPNGAAEATMIMVGDYDALRKPIFVFVRLSEPQFMFNITEVINIRKAILVLFVCR